MDNRYVVEKIFDKKDYTDKPIPKGEYEYCTFTNCNFSNSDLSAIRFLETKFRDCNFSNAKIADASFQHAIFENCKMLGLQFEQCSEFGFAATFNNCQLNHSSFYQMKLNRTTFTGSQLQGVDFTLADLKTAVLTECDLLNAIFENTNLEKVDFRNSRNYSINPESNRIRGAKFSLPEVIGLLDMYNVNID